VDWISTEIIYQFTAITVIAMSDACDNEVGAIPSWYCFFGRQQYIAGIFLMLDNAERIPAHAES